MNRHRVSSFIGAMGLPEAEQNLAFEHFGHSKDININVYQAPPAELQLKSTGNYLKLTDEGGHFPRLKQQPILQKLKR